MKIILEYSIFWALIIAFIIVIILGIYKNKITDLHSEFFKKINSKDYKDAENYLKVNLKDKKQFLNFYIIINYFNGNLSFIINKINSLDEKRYFYQDYIIYIYISYLLINGKELTKDFIKKDEFGIIFPTQIYLNNLLKAYLYGNKKSVEIVLSQGIKEYNHNMDILFLYYVIKKSDIDINKYLNQYQLNYLNNLLKTELIKNINF